VSGKPPRICVFGSANLDLVVRTPHFPAPGETILGGPFATFPGGKGANQAVAAARMGGEVCFVGCLGEDGNGERLASGLRDEGIDISALEVRSEAATGVALITVAEGGENHIVVAPGANSLPTRAWVRERSELFTDTDLLLLQLEIPIEAVEEAIGIASAAGVPVVLNAAPACSVSAEALAALDTLLVNELEHAALGGPSVARLVTTLGKRGARCLDRELIEQRAYPVQAVDTTAAGDAFAGALAVTRCERDDPEWFLPRCAAAGALACTTAGAQTSLPTRDSVEAMVAG
jgi:ribokinase